MSIESMIGYIEKSNFKKEDKLELLKGDLQHAQERLQYYKQQIALIELAIERIGKQEENGN